jgi:integrating conjugative element protein (TIGR03749 family)
MYLTLLRKLTLAISLLGACITAMGATVSTEHPPEHIVWDRSPIKVQLPVGKERRIDFPVPIKLVAPKDAVIASKPIQIREDGSVYWTAKKEFSTQRVQAVTFTGYSYLLDVSAKKGSASHPVVIIDERVPSDKEERASDAATNSYSYDIVDLTRYAAQSVYAPSRLLKPLPGVVQVPISNETCSAQLYRFHDLSFEPFAGWQSPGTPTRYVTAVRVTSKSHYETDFDPRLLRGNWIAASAQHAVLKPVGMDGDTTTWYLVSAAPFQESCP